MTTNNTKLTVIAYWPRLRSVAALSQSLYKQICSRDFSVCLFVIKLFQFSIGNIFSEFFRVKNDTIRNCCIAEAANILIGPCLTVSLAGLTFSFHPFVLFCPFKENQGHHHYRDKTSHYVDLDNYDICEEAKGVKAASNVLVISSSEIEKSFFDTVNRKLFRNLSYINQMNNDLPW